MTSTTFATDHHGNPVSGTADEIARYDVAVDRLLRYHPDVVTSMSVLVEDARDFAMGQVLAAYLCLTSTDVPDLADARGAFEQLARLDLNERETAHREAIGAWLAGDWHGASRRLDDLLIRWPGDLLALLVGHQLDFFLGNAGNLRDRVGRSLLAVDPEDPHYGFVRGMFAFGLEESGHYELAERHGLAAVDTNRDDVWAIHAVVHAYEMRGLVDTGIEFLRRREADWGDGNLFTVHNWWHLAIFLLETERIHEALRVYDDRIHNAASAGVPLEMLDASALLWRLRLDDADTGGRFAPLADAWATRTDATPWYAFNDLHAVIALAGAARLDDARAVIDRLDRYVATAPNQNTSNVMMTAQIGLPASRAIVAFAEGRHGDVLAELLPIRTVLARFGGSHAQRDVLQRTILTSAIRTGQLDVARALIGERLAVRETSVYSLRRLADLHRTRGDDLAGRETDATAAAIRDRFAIAVTVARSGSDS